MKNFWVILTGFLFVTVSIFALNSRFDMLDTSQSGTDHALLSKKPTNWGVVSVFRKPEYDNSQEIEAIRVFGSGDMLMVDHTPKIYRLSTEDFRTKWTLELKSEKVKWLRIAPDEKTFAITYSSHANIPELEIRSTSDGHILSKHRLNGLKECGFGDKRLWAWTLDYTPDSSKIVAWFDHGLLPNSICKGSENARLAVIDVKRGKMLKSRARFIWDFWPGTNRDRIKCANQHLPLVIDKTGKYFYVASCMAKIAKFRVSDLGLVKYRSYMKEMTNLYDNQLKEKLLRYSFPFKTLFYDSVEDELVTMYGGQGDGVAVRFDPGLNTFSFFTRNQGAVFSHMSYSPDRSLFMMNHEHINLWDVKTKQAKMYGHFFHSNEKARFHPKKRAIIHARNLTISIIAELPLRRLELQPGWNKTGGHVFLNNTYCVHGPGPFKYRFSLGEDTRTDYNYEEKTDCKDVYNNPFSKRADFAFTEHYEMHLNVKEAGTYIIAGLQPQAGSAAELLSRLPNWSAE